MRVTRMIALTRRSLCQMLLCTPALSACASTAPEPAPAPRKLPLYPNETPELRGLINKWADHYEVPRPLVHRLAIRESTHRPEARNGPTSACCKSCPPPHAAWGFAAMPAIFSILM